MSSPHPAGHDTPNTPLGAIPTPTAAQTTVIADTPPSPDTYAAALALAAFSDSRPSSSHHVDMTDIDDDDDHSGGVALADFQQYMDTPLPSTHDLDPVPGEEASAPPQSLMDLMHSWEGNATTSAMSPFSSPMLPFPHNSSGYLPSQTIPTSHFSSSEHSLEPPPTLQEAHLSIQDKGSFVPITSFFHLFTPQQPVVPGLDLVKVPASITRDDLQGDRYDWQGIDWTVRNTTRSIVRTKRLEYEREKVSPSQKEIRKYVPKVPNSDNFFQFRRNNTTHRAFFPHFQLRNVLAATSRYDIFYAAGHRVFHTNAEGAPADVTIDLSKRLAPDGSITTIATYNNVLIAGAFEGEYAITNLSSTYGTPCTFGRTTDYSANASSKIVNHMHLFPSRRTYTPQAVLCSNDDRLRIIDTATDTFTHSFQYSAAVNCAATSPDARLRVVVGDFQETLITNAETGRPFESLHSHTDDAFACAWADDGIHVATAAQDSTIVIYDARYWAEPLTVLKTELSVPRSLRFSPIGSGPRVLVVAEADDYLTMIDARSWASKQVFDFWGPIGGTSFTEDGSSLFIANGERRFGGIVELERTPGVNKSDPVYDFNDDLRRKGAADWAREDELDAKYSVKSSRIGRERSNVDFGALVV